MIIFFEHIYRVKGLRMEQILLLYFVKYITHLSTVLWIMPIDFCFVL